MIFLIAISHRRAISHATVRAAREIRTPLLPIHIETDSHIPPYPIAESAAKRIDRVGPVDKTRHANESAIREPLKPQSPHGIERPRKALYHRKPSARFDVVRL